MNDKCQSQLFRLGLTLFIFSTVAFLLVGPHFVQAGPELPPRDPIPTEEPKESDDDDDDGDPPTAAIVLSAQPVQGGLWASVEWEDSDGGWQLVDGWQGSTSGSQTWIVEVKDFGTGPFRWVVKDGPDGNVLGTSSEFMLPTGANQVQNVSVTLE